MFCLIPKNKRGFKIKKYNPGIAQKMIKNVIKMYFLKLILFNKKTKNYIKKKI